MSHLAAVTRCISAYTTASPINVKFGDIKVDHLPWSWAYGTYILLMRWSRSHLRLDDRSKLTASGARVLGVILNDKLTATGGHVDNLLSASTGLMYALRVLRSHGIPAASLHDVLRTTVVSKITRCSPAWSGMCSAADRARLDSFLNLYKRLGFCDKDLPSVTELFSDADDALFERINTNSQHVED